MSYCTADPDADLYALHKDQDAADAADAALHRSLSAEFVRAAAWGPEEPLVNSNVAEALYEVSQAHPELIESFFWRAASQKCPALRAMVQEVADAWASLTIAVRAPQDASDITGPWGALTDSQKRKTLESMSNLGGSFARSLGQAALQADERNRSRIFDAFPEFLALYGPDSAAYTTLHPWVYP